MASGPTQASGPGSGRTLLSSFLWVTGSWHWLSCLWSGIFQGLSLHPGGSCAPKNSRVGSTCLDSIMHCLCCSTWLPRQLTWLKLFASSSDSYPCASSYVTSDHELFSCHLAQTSPSPEGKNLFLEGPSWVMVVKTLNLKWNLVFWGVESWGWFSGTFCWFGVGEGCRGQALVVVGVPPSCSEDTLRSSPPVCQWSCCSFRGGGTSIKVLFVLPGQGGWRLCSVASPVYQLAAQAHPHPPTPTLGANSSLAEKQSWDSLLSSTPAWGKFKKPWNLGT